MIGTRARCASRRPGHARRFCVNGSGDLNWARANYDTLAAWGREMFAADKDGNGLIEYPGMPLLTALRLAHL